MLCLVSLHDFFFLCAKFNTSMYWFSIVLKDWLLILNQWIKLSTLFLLYLVGRILADTSNYFNVIYEKLIRLDKINFINDTLKTKINRFKC